MQEVSRAYTSPLLDKDEIKHGFTGSKSFQGFREMGPWTRCGLGSCAGLDCCVVLLGKRLYSHSASLHPGEKKQKNIGKLLEASLQNAEEGGEGVQGVGVTTCDGLTHSGESSNTTSRVASCYRSGSLRISVRVF